MDTFDGCALTLRFLLTLDRGEMDGNGTAAFVAVEVMSARTFHHRKLGGM